MEKNNQTFVRLTGLWQKKGKKGVFFQGQLSPWANILIFENRYKETEQDPDLILYVSRFNKPDQPKEIDDKVEAL